MSWNDNFPDLTETITHRTNVTNGTLYPKVYNNYETCHLWNNIKCS